MAFSAAMLPGAGSPDPAHRGGLRGHLQPGWHAVVRIQPAENAEHRGEMRDEALTAAGRSDPGRRALDRAPVWYRALQPNVTSVSAGHHGQAVVVQRGEGAAGPAQIIRIGRRRLTRSGPTLSNTRKSLWRARRGPGQLGSDASEDHHLVLAAAHIQRKG
jgi:hypothetical protein